MYILLTALSAGLASASALALAAVGFTLQFSIGNLFNLAFGALMTLAGFFAYALNAAGVGIWLSAAVAVGGLAICSILLGRGVYRPFVLRARRFGKGVEASVIMVSFGVAVIVEYGVQAIWGSANVYTYRVGLSAIAVAAGGFVLTWQDVAALSVTALLCGLLAGLLRFTQLGRAMRATANNEGLARASGVPVERVLDVSWLISGVFCGLAGVLFALSIGSLDSFTGSNELLLVIAAAIVGGIGSPLGGVLGALLVSVVSEVAAAYVAPDLKYTIAFAMLILVLLFRPVGLVGGSARVEAITK